MRGENPQGVGVLDISFKDFQGVLERLTHGSYVHRSDHTRKNKEESKVCEMEEETKSEIGLMNETLLGYISVSSFCESHRVKRREKREKREKESASCCFYAVLESQEGGIVRTRVRINTLAPPLLIQKYIYL